MLKRLSALTLILVLALCATAHAGHGPTEKKARKAIVLASFGTSYPTAINAILNIRDKVVAANPGIPVRLAFTSDIIRRKWQKRAADPAWHKAHPAIPAEVLHVTTPMAAIATLQSEGYRDITVQPTHLFAGEEFANLAAMIAALQSLRTIKERHRPFHRLALGRPALGMPGDSFPYVDDLKAAASALAGQVAMAKKAGAALVYMGHGNDYYSTGIYSEFQTLLREKYKWPIFVGCVEGHPSLTDVMDGLKPSGKKRVMLRPFMVVAGDHASNDMAGDEDDSWKTLLTRAGYTVTCVMKGLGDDDAWADIYVRHLRDAMGN